MFFWKSLIILYSLGDHLPSETSKEPLFIQVNDNNVVEFQGAALIMAPGSVSSCHMMSIQW